MRKRERSTVRKMDNLIGFNSFPPHPLLLLQSQCAALLCVCDSQNLIFSFFYCVPACLSICLCDNFLNEILFFTKYFFFFKLSNLSVSIFLSVCLSVCLCVCLCVYLSVYLAVWSVYLAACLSVYLCRYGSEFFRLNFEALEAYGACNTSEEVSIEYRLSSSTFLLSTAPLM